MNHKIPKKFDYYYIISTKPLKIESIIWNNDEFDNEMYYSGNFFNTENEALKILKKIQNIFLEKDL